MKTSFDHGATWKDTITVAGATTLGRDGMPGCVDWNSDLICVFETNQGGDELFRVKKVISKDDGKTWGDRDLVYQATGENHNGTL